MKGIILAAGRGSRMRTLTSSSPKCLIKLKGKTLLQRQIDALKEAGVYEIGIVTGYQREKLLCFGLKEFHNACWSETNMMSSLACAKKWLEDSPCIISYSDIFYHHSAVTLLIRQSAPIAITYDPNWLSLWEKRFDDPLTDAETFLINNEKILLEIGKKPSGFDRIQGQFMGLINLTPEGWQEIVKIRESLSQTEKNQMDFTTTLQKIIEGGRLSIRALPIQAYWGELDSETDLSYYESNVERID